MRRRLRNACSKRRKRCNGAHVAMAAVLRPTLTTRLLEVESGEAIHHEGDEDPYLGGLVPMALVGQLTVSRDSSLSGSTGTKRPATMSS